MVLVGGHGRSTAGAAQDVGSFWPYATTVRLHSPHHADQGAQSLGDDRSTP